MTDGTPFTVKSFFKLFYYQLLLVCANYKAYACMANAVYFRAQRHCFKASVFYFTAESYQFKAWTDLTGKLTPIHLADEYLIPLST